MDLRQIFGNLAINSRLQAHQEVSYTMARGPGLSAERDWWAGDHMWHVDGTRWDTQPVFTVIGCRSADEGAPTTKLLDSVRLLDVTREDGFWQRFGVSHDDLYKLSTVFKDSTYYDEALPFLKNFMNPEEVDAVDFTLQQNVKQSGAQSLEDYVAQMDEKYPPKKFDLINRTPLSDEEALFIDAGGRCSNLVGPDGQDLTHILHALRWEYLAGNRPVELGIVCEIGWTANKAAIFPQVGTLHKASPGNAHDRELHLAFLTDKLT